MNRQFEINGATYSVGRLDAMKGFSLARKLAPALPFVMPMIETIFNAEATPEDRVNGEIAIALIATQNLTDEAASQVLGMCLDAVQRKQETGWARLRKGEALMFSDLNPEDLFRIAIEVVKDNLAGFFPIAELKVFKPIVPLEDSDSQE